MESQKSYRPRRFLSMAIDWVIAAVLLLIGVIIYLLITKKIDFSDWWVSFSAQYESLLEGGLLFGITFFIYDTICQFLFGRSFGQKVEKIRVVPTQEKFYTPFLRRLFRAFIYNNYIFFIFNAIVLFVVPPYKTIEDHVFKYEVINDIENIL